MTSIVFSIIVFVVTSFFLLVLAEDSLGCPSTSSSPATFNIQIYQTNENTQSSSSSSSSSSVNDQINSLMNPFFQSLGYDLQTIGGGGATPNFIEVLATTETPLRSNITCSGSTNNNNNNNNQKCFDFTFSVNSDANMIKVISSKINVAKSNNNINLNYYTRNSLEYSFASLYRNASSTPEVIATLDLLGWNSVSVLSSSCATQKSSSAATALMKLDKLDFTGSSSQSGKESDECNRFSVCARSSSSSQNNNCDSSSSSFGQAWNDDQLAQLKLAFSQLLGGITIVTNTTTQNNNNSNNNQQVFSIQQSSDANNNNNTMTALELISQVGLEDISAGLDALVFRGGSNKNNNQVKMIFPTWQRLGVNVSSSAPSCFDAAKNDPDLFTSSAARSPIDFIIPFKCDQNNSSSGAILQQHDALTLAQNITSSANKMLMTNFSLPSSGTPLTIVNYTFFDGDLSSSSSRRRRRCGVKIVISSSSSQKQQQFQKYYSCLTLWGDQSGSATQIMAGAPASSSPKKQTPPLMLISMIVTAILWVLLCAYCYKFLPRHRRTNLPHQQNSQQALEEAMLSNEEIQQQRMNNNNANNNNHKISENDIENDHDHEDMNARTKKSADDLRRYSPMGGDEKEAEPNKIFAM